MKNVNSIKRRQKQKPAKSDKGKKGIIEKKMRSKQVSFVRHNIWELFAMS